MLLTVLNVATSAQQPSSMILQNHDIDFIITSMLSGEGFLKSNTGAVLISGLNPYHKAIGKPISYVVKVNSSTDNSLRVDTSLTAKAEVVTKEDFTSVKIPQALIDRRLAMCENSLIGHLIYRKGINHTNWLS